MRCEWLPSAAEMDHWQRSEIMAFEMRELSGSLFKNARREKDTHPNATGTALIDGVEYWVSAWVKVDRNGQKWQSLAFKRKDAAGADRAPQTKAEADLSDDIPW